MKTFHFIQATVSDNVKDPHSKALEPDCLSPRLAITTQSLKGEVSSSSGSIIRTWFDPDLLLKSRRE